jgi:hypothetical protein
MVLKAEQWSMSSFLTKVFLLSRWDRAVCSEMAITSSVDLLGGMQTLVCLWYTQTKCSSLTILICLTLLIRVHSDIDLAIEIVLL